TRAKEDDAKLQCLAALSRWGLEPGDPTIFNKEYATRVSPLRTVPQVKLSTNIFDLQTIASYIFHYHLEFKKVFETGPYAGKSYPLVDPNQRAYYYTMVKNRQWLGKLFSAFIKKYPNVFGNDPDHFCYDFAATLYSLVELVSLETTMFLTKDETAEAIYLPVKITLTVKKPEMNVFNIDSQNRSDVQNIRPGTVVDEHAVSSVFCEYYLNSHLALQGTAKTPKYTVDRHVLYSSEKKVYLDLFERWTNALCFDFQIVTSPTSIPAPVYIAQRYAERGRQIWNTFSSSVDANLARNVFKIGGQNVLCAARASSSNSSEASPNDAALHPYFETSIDYNFTKKKKSSQ
uniref:Piwi domain-containing protein n=1 Tax=Panagrolaimus sp. PS1159 TaxID=55785 RepID=A0AC35F1R5_9BILA